MEEHGKDPVEEIRALIARLEGETDPESLWVMRLLKEYLAEIENRRVKRPLN